MNTNPDHLGLRPPTPTTSPPPPIPTQFHHNPSNTIVNPNPNPNFQVTNVGPPQRKKRSSKPDNGGGDKKRPKSRSNNKSAPKITTPCTECGRAFWSWKALFGHMRCHPDRLWRGIHPPPQPLRVIINAATSSSTSPMSEEEHIAASSLLILAAGPHQLLLSSAAADPEIDECQFFRCSSSSTSCKKAFRAHQGLAVKIDKNIAKGSIASTNEEHQHCAKATVDLSYGVDEEARNANDVAVESSRINMATVSTRHYECNICSKVFSSGQALGGHKRWHWEKGENAATASVVTMATTQVAEMMSSDGSFGGNVDLNLPAASAAENEDDLSLGMDLDLRLGL